MSTYFFTHFTFLTAKSFKKYYFSLLPSGQSVLTPFTQYEPFGQGVQALPSSYSPKLQLDATLTPVAVIESFKRRRILNNLNSVFKVCL